MPGAESRGAISAPALQGRRLVMRDNVHLFDPGAEHHEVLATEGTGATSAGKPSAPPYASPCVQHCLLTQRTADSMPPSCTMSVPCRKLMLSLPPMPLHGH